MKGLNEKVEDYALDIRTIEKWQATAGVKNRKVIKYWATKKREMIELKKKVKERKNEVAERLQKEKEDGAKITDKMLQMMIEGDEELLELQTELELLEVDAGEAEKVQLLYRDLWNSAPTLRQAVNNMERAEMLRNDD